MVDFALWLHLAFVSVWVGGQIVLAFLVPAIRRRDADPSDTRAVLTLMSHRFQAVAWAALIGSLFSGIWLVLLEKSPSPEWGIVLFEKLGVVTLAALAVAAHAFWIGPRLRGQPPVSDEGTSREVRRLRALSGILALAGLLLSLFALWLGIRLFFS